MVADVRGERRFLTGRVRHRIGRFRPKVVLQVEERVEVCSMIGDHVFGTRYEWRDATEEDMHLIVLGGVLRK